MTDIDGIIKIGGVVISFIGFGFLLKFQVERLKEEDVKQWAAISKLRDWATEHDKDSARTRLEIEREFGRSREDVSKAVAKMDHLISVVEKFSEKLDRLEEKLERKEK